MSNDLEVLFPGRDVEIRGQTLRVSPFTARQLPKVFALARDIMPAFKQADGDLMGAFALIGDPILELAALSLGKKIEIFDRMLPDDMIAVLSAVMEENYDFFTQKIEPMMAGVMEAIAQKAKAKTDSAPSSNA